MHAAPRRPPQLHVLATARVLGATAARGPASSRALLRAPAVACMLAVAWAPTMPRKEEGRGPELEVA